ncbi:Uncharacterised protein [Sphingobacterium multivorum]|uniref:Uncharacterized protein n=1 Tax=Sphingobacterium multivorum TaxID=28454 RepID=A0A2X2J2N6_SPHMU|nr:hypothetical protein [Sphingobacterium multivorum]SPZ88562.1 Uncharacterised protein [Sphingobacterium multivorum]
MNASTKSSSADPDFLAVKSLFESKIIKIDEVIGKARSHKDGESFRASI